MRGVAVRLPGSVAAEKEEYFQFTPAALIAGYKTSRIGGGVLRSFRHKTEFRVAEYHEDRETLIFVSGTAIMLFLDLENGRAKIETACLVRIKEGTQGRDSRKGRRSLLNPEKDILYLLLREMKRCVP